MWNESTNKERFLQGLWAGAESIGFIKMNGEGIFFIGLGLLAIYLMIKANNFLNRLIGKTEKKKWSKEFIILTSGFLEE